MPERGADRAQVGGMPGVLAERVGEQHHVDRDRGREQRVLDGEQAEAEAGGEEEDRDGGDVAVDRFRRDRGDHQAEHRAGRPQDQAQVRFVAVGPHHEEDRQRDPEAVVVHVEDPVDGDTGRERGAEADPVAAGVGFECQVLAQGLARPRRQSQPLGSPRARRSAKTQTSSDQATWVRPPSGHPDERRQDLVDRAGRSPGRPSARARPRGRRSPAAASRRRSSRRARRPGPSPAPPAVPTGC